MRRSSEQARSDARRPALDSFRQTDSSGAFMRKISERRDRSIEEANDEAAEIEFGYVARVVRYFDSSESGKSYSRIIAAFFDQQARLAHL